MKWLIVKLQFWWRACVTDQILVRDQMIFRVELKKYQVFTFFFIFFYIFF